MHERALMDDVMRNIESVARANGARRVTRVVVRLGTLSHFTPEHFQEHFVDASLGTVAEGAEIEATIDGGGADVLIESGEIEEPD
jgi:hydrogenase nickel incorporation protein HypA/HybF